MCHVGNFFDEIDVLEAFPVKTRVIEKQTASRFSRGADLFVAVVIGVDLGYSAKLTGSFKKSSGLTNFCSNSGADA
ncbi:hypothetical protein [Schlesneria sp. T3-172]|uniref:hypothetical protein n=1 Tax=Schlesneria sphaerica TaxID=3373610 RepID=UPI0037C784D2